VLRRQLFVNTSQSFVQPFEGVFLLVEIFVLAFVELGISNDCVSGLENMRV
jgi:hypothetical protein